MKSLSDMIWIEMRKALRSRIPLFATLGSLFMPLGIGFLIFVSRNSAISEKLGLISPKANLVAYASTTWASYLVLVAEIIGVGGFFLFVLVTSWVFGREFADGTLKDMWAVPVPRSTILLAKFVVVALLSAAMTLVIIALSLVMGAIVNLPEGSPSVFLQGSAGLLVTALLTIAVVAPFALIASIGRGYLLPLGVAVLTAVMANVFAVAGWGEFFPWGVPGLYAQGKGALGPASYWIVLLTCLAGMAGTYLWWRLADQNR
jgi:ABC-type transport system involved in multi-copper enzyme maturation permease subunit